jgi:acid phosphatase
MNRRPLGLLTTLVLGLCAACGGAAPAAPSASAMDVAPAGVTKLLVFVEENHSLGEMQHGMPYTYALARRFGHATRYHAIRHPSLPNYLAIAGGSTYGVTDDNPPSAHRLRGPSVFGQAIAHGRTAAVYAQSMPGSCATSNHGEYAVRHNPWTYFVSERRLCRRFDVPVSWLGPAVADGRLPNVGMVVPDVQHDAHDGSLATADAWFKMWMTRVFRGPDWRSGHLAVVLTADEDDSSHGNRVLTVVVYPGQRGNAVSTPLSHYSLTRLYEDVAGAPYRNNAGSAPSMSRAFGLRVG